MFRSELDLLLNYPGCCNVRRMMSSFKSLPLREQVPIYIHLSKTALISSQIKHPGSDYFVHYYGKIVYSFFGYMKL